MGVNDCRWQSEPTLTEPAGENDSPRVHQKGTEHPVEALFFSIDMDFLSFVKRGQTRRLHGETLKFLEIPFVY